MILQCSPKGGYPPPPLPSHFPLMYIYDRLWEKEQFPAKVDFAIITPKVGGVNFGHIRSSARGDSRIRYLAAGTNASAIHP